MSLFGDGPGAQGDLEKPEPPDAPEWSIMERMSREKEVVGMYISAHPLDSFKYEIDNFCNKSLSDLKDLQQMEGKEISFAGIVTDAQHRLTKHNKGFGVFTLEDYTGDYTFRIFGDSYIRFKEYLQLNYFLYVKAKVVRGWNGDEMRLYFNEISTLTELLDKKGKSITLRFDIEQLSEQVLQDIEIMIKTNKGNKELSFEVYDKEEKISVKLIGKKKKINISTELIEFMKERDWDFKMN
jgi:DNA polymerase-3 subunit alpha